MREQGKVSLLTVTTLLTLGRLAIAVVPRDCPRLTNVCYYDKVAKLLPVSGRQYFAVGGLFDIHQRGQDAYSCGAEFNPAGILHTQAFLWSLSYWQTDSSSVSIGAVVFDSCERKAQLIQNVLGFEQCNLRVSDISRHNVVGFVGPTDNMAAIGTASLTADMELTLISPAADAQILSNAKRFPYFLRTTPTIQVDIDIMTYMLTHVETQVVAVIYQETQMAAVNSFNDRMQENKICISGSYSMSGEEESSALRTFVRDTLASLEPTRFVALFMTPDFLERFLDHVSAEEDIRSMNLVFIMTSQIRLNSNIFQGQHAVAASDAIILERGEPASVQEAVRQFKDYWKAETILTTINQEGRISDPFLVQYLNAGNRLPEFDVDAAYTIMATRAFVEGTKRAGQDSGCGTNAYLCSQFFDSELRGSTIYETIRRATDFFSVDRNDQGDYLNGDLRDNVIRYNIYRYHMNGSLSKIGEYTGGATPTLSQPIKGLRPYGPGQCQDTPCPQCPLITTTATPGPSTSLPSTTPRKCKPDDGGNLTRVYYPYGQEITGAYMIGQRHDSEFGTRFDIGQRWIIALGVLAGLGIVAVFVFEVYILYKLLGTRMGHKWRTMWLGQLLLLGVLLCYITLFAYLFIPSRETCYVTRFGVGVSCSVCFAVLLVKLMVILTSKSLDPSHMPGDGQSTNYLRGVYQFLMFVFIVGVQVVIDAQWLISVPPEAVKVVSNNGEKVWVCNHYTFRASGSIDAMTTSSMTDMSNFVRSEFENHVFSLVYVMFLMLITTVLALKAHGIITNYRESVFIGVASGFCIPIWLAWTLVGGLNKDHGYAHEFGDACIAFGLFVTATLVLFAMFVPKVRQLGNMGVEGIYFEDDHDTIYAGSVIMAPSYKSPNSIIYVNSHGDPVVLGNGEGVTYIRQTSSDKPTPASTYSAPPAYLKKGSDSTRGGNVLRVTDDLSGRRPLEKKQAASDVGYRTVERPRSTRGTLPRSRSYTSVGAL